MEKCEEGLSIDKGSQPNNRILLTILASQGQSRTVWTSLVGIHLEVLANNVLPHSNRRWAILVSSHEFNFGRETTPSAVPKGVGFPHRRLDRSFGIQHLRHGCLVCSVSKLLTRRQFICFCGTECRRRQTPGRETKSIHGGIGM